MKKLLVISFMFSCISCTLPMAPKKIKKEVIFLNHTKEDLSIRLSDGKELLFSLVPDKLTPIELEGKHPIIKKLQINDYVDDETNPAVKEMNDIIAQNNGQTPVIKITKQLLDIFAHKDTKRGTFINETSVPLQITINNGYTTFDLQPKALLTPGRRRGLTISKATDITPGSSSVYQKVIGLPNLGENIYIQTLTINGVDYPATNPIIKMFNANLQRKQENIEPISISDKTLNALEASHK